MFRLTDYKIQSQFIYWNVVGAINIMLLFIVVTKLTVDIKSIDLPTLVIFYAFILFVSILSIIWDKSVVLKSLLVLVIYFLIEVPFIQGKTNFHVVVFWFPIVSLIAMIVTGLKSAILWFIVIVISHIFNSLFLKNQVGETYIVEVFRLPVFATGLIFMISMFAFFYLLYQMLGNAYDRMKVKTEELDKLKCKYESRNAVLENYLNSLIDLYQNESVATKEHGNIYRTICWTAAHTLGVNRVGVWLFEEGNNMLERKFLYETEGENAESRSLRREDYPRLFQKIESKQYLKADTATKHPDTTEMVEGYIKPMQICSMLIVPVITDGKAIGAICCESRYTERSWSSEDNLFLQSLSDFISLNFKNVLIKNLLAEVKKQNIQLFERSNEIETMNEELTMMNETLEDNVTKRTQELEMQNAQLTEYAFINSHLLRAPIARILGLANILTIDTSMSKDEKLINALKSSTDELDVIVKKISDVLIDGNRLSRMDIDKIIAEKFKKS